MKRSLLLIAGLVIAFSARCDVHAVPADASKNQMVLTTSESVNLYYNTDDVNIVSFDAINGAVTIASKYEGWSDVFMRNIVGIRFEKAAHTTLEKRILGTWLHEAYDELEGWCCQRITFYADGTVSDEEYLAEDGPTGVDDSFGKYTLNGNIITIYWDNEDGWWVSCTVEINGDSMVVTYYDDSDHLETPGLDSDVYTRVK